MEQNVDNDMNYELEKINELSEILIQESYLAGACRSVWILGHDDGDSGMN